MPAWEGKVVKMVIVSTLSAFQSTRVQFMREKKSDATPRKRPHGIILVQYLSPPLLRCSISGKTFEEQYFWCNVCGAISIFMSIGANCSRWCAVGSPGSPGASLGILGWHDL